MNEKTRNPFQGQPMNVHRRTSALKMAYVILSGACMQTPRPGKTMQQAGGMDTAINHHQMTGVVDKLLERGFLREVDLKVLSGASHKRQHYLLTLGGLSYLRRLEAAFDGQNDLMAELDPASASPWTLHSFSEVA